MTTTDTSGTIATSQIGQFAINVHNTDRTIEFYRDTLGLRLLFTAGRLTFFDCGGVRLNVNATRTTGVRSPGVDLVFQGGRYPVCACPPGAVQREDGERTAHGRADA